MLKFIFGPSGSGKTTEMVSLAAAALSAGRHVFVLVPEQAVLSTERLIADRAGDAPTISLEVLSFRRLANRVFRSFGGLAYNYIDRGGRSLVMWRVLSELSPLLTEYNGISLTDRNMIHLMLDTVKELKSCRVTPSALERTAEKLDGDNCVLCRRLSDLSLIYASYENILKNEYDDPQDDLSKLAEKLSQHDFFKGTSVFIDSFNSFTGQECETLRYIVRQAEELTVTLGYEGDDGQLMFENLRRTERFFRETAADYHIPLGEPIRLPEPLRFRDSALKALESSLRHMDSGAVEPYDGDIGGIRIIECGGMFAESEAVCKDILSRVAGGARWRDIAVISRALNSYEGIIDAVAEKHGIPIFMSKRTDIKAHPVIRFILTALSILRRGWQTTDVISCIKTGLAGISPEECDLLESYVSVWKIAGKRWYDDDDWSMNPDGYVEKLSDEGADKIARVNEIRRRFVLPLREFGSVFKQGSVAEITVALYRYLCDSGCDKAIVAPDFAFDERQLDSNRRLWKLLMESLDKLVSLAGDIVCGAEEYAGLLELLLDEADIGSIPAAVDEVTVGNAALLRSGEVRHVYILGTCDGSFPAVPRENGFFSDGDRRLLSELGVQLAPDGEYRTGEELFFFYRAVASSSDSITFLYPDTDMAGGRQRPSYMLARIRDRFPQLKIEKFRDFTPEQLIWSKKASFEYAALLADTPAGEALRKIYILDGDYHDRLSSLETPITDTEADLASDTAKKLFGGSVAFTQSRLDSYVLCRFAHCCRYIIRLEEKRRGSFQSSDIGNFMHRVFEQFMLRATAGGTLELPPQREREELLDSVIDEYIASICRDKKQNNNRLLHLFERLRISARLLVNNIADEFAQSSFTPRFFELPITFDNSDGVKPLAIPLDDGTNAYLRGIADRVDTYEKGGKLYIRVIDYKTGAKEFSMSDISLGLNLQMLLYLFALWKSGDENFNRRLANGSVKEILPAGVLYFSAKAPTISSDTPLDDEEIESTAASLIKRRGMLLNDPEILRAMEPELKGKYIPVKLNRAGEPAGGAELASLEDFGRTMREVSDIVVRISGELKRGNVSARPLKTAEHDACEYCPYKPVCRKI